MRYHIKNVVAAAAKGVAIALTAIRFTLSIFTFDPYAFPVPTNAATNTWVPDIGIRSAAAANVISAVLTCTETAVVGLNSTTSLPKVFKTLLAFFCQMRQNQSPD